MQRLNAGRGGAQGLEEVGQAREVLVQKEAHRDQGMEDLLAREAVACLLADQEHGSIAAHRRGGSGAGALGWTGLLLGVGLGRR